MPESWVRAAILVRTNSLASGNSGVRPELIDCIANLLQKDIIVGLFEALLSSMHTS